MKVTTTSIITVRPSTWIPAWMSTCPMRNHCTCLVTASGGRPQHDWREEQAPLASRNHLALHEIGLVEVDALAVAVDEQDDGEPHADFGGGYRDDEQGEDLAGDVVAEGAERHQVDVD